MKPNLVQEGVKYGIICGLIAIVIMFGSWAAGMDVFMPVSLYSKFVPYMLVIILIAAFSVRKRNNGFLSFGEALKFAFLAYAIAEVLYGVSNYVLFNLVDSNLAHEVTERSIPGTRKLLEKLGTPEADVEKAITDMRSKGNDVSIGKIVLGMGIGLIWDFVMSLLISLIVRKEEKFSD